MQIVKLPAGIHFLCCQEKQVTMLNVFFLVIVAVEFTLNQRGCLHPPPPVQALKNVNIVTFLGQVI